MLKHNQINTIVGPSGSGKSKWVTSQLGAMYRREPFFGRQTKPLPETLYISLDRSQGEAESLMQYAGLSDIPNLKYESWRMHLRELGTFTNFENSLNKRKLQPELLIIDGIGFLIKDIIKQREIGILFGQFDSWLGQHPGASIILIHHTAKAREGQAYKKHRERAMGSGAWAQCSALYISIASKTDEPDCAEREAVIMSNDASTLIVPFLIGNDGAIVSGFPIEAEFVDGQWK